MALDKSVRGLCTGLSRNHGLSHGIGHDGGYASSNEAGQNALKGAEGVRTLGGLRARLRPQNDCAALLEGLIESEIGDTYANQARLETVEQGKNAFGSDDPLDRLECRLVRMLGLLRLDLRSS